MTRQRADRPNVVVFFTDQQRWDTTGVHGCPLDLTPNFDRMARRGTDVHYSFTCQPVCGPARSCFQTGMYATNTGVYRNGIPLAQDAATLAKSFNAAGYATGYIGKWHLGHAGPGPGRGARRLSKLARRQICWSSPPTPTTPSCSTTTATPSGCPAIAWMR